MPRRYTTSDSSDDESWDNRRWADPDDCVPGVEEYTDYDERRMQNLNPDTLPEGWKIPSSLLKSILGKNEYGDECEIDGDDEPVTFIRPDGSIEEKSVQWCLDNDFCEVEEGAWSGPWYWTDRGEEPPPDGSRITPVVSADWGKSGLLNKVDDVTFASIVNIKAYANKFFSKGNYKKAV